MKLDKYQKEAVVSKEKNLLVVAPPGSGKTTVLINRVKYLLEREIVNSSNIIIITFTRAAALNMKDRFQKLMPDTKTPFFGTFHGLCYKILGNFIRDIKIIESNETYRIIHNVLVKKLDEVGEEKVKEVMNNISLLKCGGENIEEFKPSLAKEVFIECYNSYESYKTSKGLLDFDDLQIQCKRLFLNNKSVLDGYRRMFKHILVDEFQDCDKLQIELLSMLNSNNNIFAVGDEDQSIYSFRGSRPEFMVSFDKIFEKGKKKYLKYNYRSCIQIVEVSKELIKNNKMRNDKSFEGWRKDEGTLRLSFPMNEGAQVEDICSKIEEYFKSGIGYKENAILYRTNIEARSIIDGFIRRKIPFKLLDKEYNFFKHFICEDIIAYLKLAINPYNKKAFVRVINKPFRYIAKSSIDIVKNNPYEENVFETLKDIKDMPPFQIRKIDELKRDIAYLNKMSLRAAIDFIIMDLGYTEYIREYSIKFKQNMDELIDIVEEFRASAEGYSSIINFLSHIDNVEENIKTSKNVEKDGVILSTIHGVKGMEFRNVYIININEDTIPHKNCAIENIEEERRLFYVGITRAINNLYLYSPKMTKGKFRNPSVFLKELKLKEKDSDSGYGFKINDSVRHKTFGVGDVVNIENGDIQIRFKDGFNRKFSLRILVENKLLYRN